MQYLKLLNSKRDFSKDVDRIKAISSKIDNKLSDVNNSDEELQDLDKIVGIADFMLQKYDDKKEMKSILKYFVSIISETGNSVNDLDDEISELIISAEDSINKVKDMHTHISEKSDFKNNYHDGPDYCKHETSAINLTTDLSLLGIDKSD